MSSGGNLLELSPGTEQKLAVTSSSAASTAVGSGTQAVLLCPDADCFITIGPSPTATLTSTYMPAKVPQIFACNPGDKIAAIAAVSANLYITEAK